ncbi:hypothetical protein SEA_ROSMARINUS_1 [Mycobacterium Phage Rosmarinus]|uniref:Uncharacterized protein n=3 Tax=Anayavirus TaxID=2946797 RepID=A0A5J6TQ98_9CAUD|nr:hypothetical protein CL60_gp01 [Mycobacterium phage BarrelRoll]APU93107.1 hypothetical protein SEA_CREW_1 [Mycobacterium phage CREW]ASR86835.1 hypothetical protein SEA_JECKYLL_1 [Mycobacterium phage Jeckyll]AXH47032.1 hypothetical protein SEA_BEEST_1 [Mycobacterium phage BEEST]AXH49971.1 hypothetical protein SEA_HOMURA_1 [Mycobacterium phage Homura]AXQ51519.1 hypothetical protein SEA_BELLADONNA_1 [Mycobacterium phage Belladonna]AYB68860.1 hypothetical protein SEA_DALMURI_1 [Mycobacterium p
MHMTESEPTARVWAFEDQRDRAVREQSMHIALKAADIVGLGDVTLIEAADKIADFILDGKVDRRPDAERSPE